ncbi:MAG: efflux RND transporter periplasmic adaptor subunit [Pirellulaceae bacterium]
MTTTFSDTSNEPGSQTAPKELVDSSLTREIHELAEKSKTLKEMLAGIANLASKHSDCLGLWLAPVESADKPLQFQPLIDRDDQSLFSLLRNDFDRFGPLIVQQKDSMSVPLQGQISVSLSFVPLFDGSRVSLIFAGCFSTKRQAETRHTWLLTLLANTLASWMKTCTVDNLEQRLVQNGRLLTAVAAISNAANIQSAAIAAVNHLKLLFNANHVYLSLRKCESSPLKLAAISDVEEFTPSARVVSLADQLCHKFGSSLESHYFCTDDNIADQTEIEGTLHEFGDLTQSKNCWVLPLVVNGVSVGVVLVLANELPDAASQSTIASQIALLARQIESVQRTHDSVLVHFWNRCRAKLQENIIRKLMLTAAGLLAIMLVPVPFRLTCESIVQPVSRRFVTAPFEGRLEKTLAKSGDVVAVGDLLARMDAQSIRFELSGLAAELAAAEKKRDQALAQKDIATGQIQKSEANRIRSRIEQAEKNLRDLEIRSPIDGLVVSGDLDQVEGATLQLGQNLFEIGPLDKMLVEVEVLEDQIRFVHPQSRVSIKFNAYPFRTWNGIVKKVHRRSEIIDNKNVFIAEVEIDNAAGELQPGMQGYSKVSSGWAPIGWILLHRTWDNVRYWWVW